jgi:hypothetical protein
MVTDALAPAAARACEADVRAVQLTAGQNVRREGRTDHLPALADFPGGTPKKS